MKTATPMALLIAFFVCGCSNKGDEGKHAQDGAYSRPSGHYIFMQVKDDTIVKVIFAYDLYQGANHLQGQAELSGPWPLDENLNLHVATHLDFGELTIDGQVTSDREIGISWIITGTDLEGQKIGGTTLVRG